MRKSDVLSHFGGNQSEVARVLGITRASVNGWPDLIPEAQAYRLERLTRGKLKADVAEYDRRRQQHRVDGPSAAA